MANKIFFSDEEIDSIMNDRRITDRERFCFDYYYLKQWKISEIAVALYTYEARRKEPRYVNHNGECYSLKTVQDALKSVRKKVFKIHRETSTL